MIKVLLVSPAFPPSVGGIEQFSEHLARALAARGFEVVVQTESEAVDDVSAPYRVVRSPSVWQRFRLASWCDVFFQINVGLRGLWPLVLVRRPWVVYHGDSYEGAGIRGRLIGWIKKSIVRFSTRSFPASGWIADRIPGHHIAGLKPYRDRLFREIPGVERTEGVLFAGRLVSDKGCDVLLRAIAALRRQGLETRVTIAGDGPDRGSLEDLAQVLGIKASVRFVGALEPSELAVEMNKHQVLAIPSTWEEPFGTVALEGIACGCVIVSSNCGGLPEAVGKCGALVEPGNSGALADTLSRIMGSQEERSQYRAQGKEHLKERASDRVFDRYREQLLELGTRRR